MRPRIALATCAEYPRLSDDDQALLPALAAVGIDAEIALWRDEVVWSRFDGVLLRSVWDYFRCVPELLAWLGSLEAAGVPCWNEPELVRWNLDKRYLKDLEAKGVATVPTLWIEPDLATSLSTVLERIADAGWEEMVLKPTVSAGAWRTRRVRRDALADATALITEVLGSSALMVQPFLPEFVAAGEHSLLFFDGEFSHAALKRPKAGDFRVQWVHGGSQVPESVPTWLVRQARAVLDAAPSPGLYARVDGIVRDGHFVLVELEQIEPYLFLSQSAGAADRLARALRARLGSGALPGRLRDPTCP